MLRPLSGALLVATLLAALAPAPAQTDKKSGPNEKTYPLGTYAGKILDVDEPARKIKLRVVNKAAELVSVSGRRPNYSVRDKPFDLTILVAEKAKFRVPAKAEFDDKGKPKPPRVDKKDPDRKLGGVKGEFSDVEKDQMAVFKLRRNKAGTLVVADVVIILGKESDSR